MVDNDLTAEARPVPGFDGYYVTPDGTIWSRKIRNGSRPGALGKWRKMNPCLRHGEYLQVSLRQDNRHFSMLVHRLVLLTFVGPLPEGKVSRHVNGDYLDNRLSNLCYGTQAENMQDKNPHGTAQVGERGPTHKLTNSDVAEIRKMHTTGVHSFASLGRQFKVHPATIQRVVNRKRWKHLP